MEPEPEDDTIFTSEVQEVIKLIDRMPATQTELLSAYE